MLEGWISSPRLKLGSEYVFFRRRGVLGLKGSLARGRPVRILDSSPNAKHGSLPLFGIPLFWLSCSQEMCNWLYIWPLRSFFLEDLVSYRVPGRTGSPKVFLQPHQTRQSLPSPLPNPQTNHRRTRAACLRAPRLADGDDEVFEVCKLGPQHVPARATPAVRSTWSQVGTLLCISCIIKDVSWKARSRTVSPESQ